MSQQGMRGSVTPFVVVFMVLTGTIAMLLGRLGGASLARAQARTAADAAALAAAAEGREAAAELAEANGGRLVEYSEHGTDRIVAVTVGPATAIARARRGSSSAIRRPGTGTTATPR